MTALALERTKPAFPLGQPLDGRPRYGMTPEQARVYRLLVEVMQHDLPFAPNFRELAKELEISHGKAHDHFQALVERGWLKHTAGYGLYEFVLPVMHFAEPSDA